MLTGGLADPHLTGALAGDPRTVGQLKLLIAGARESRSVQSPQLAVTEVRAATGAMVNDRAVTAQIGQMLLFFLTIVPRRHGACPS